ncbi:MAG: hypothetical protein IKL53_03100 [Lachnospiraceae bacterium]|nr:hypothetical protein [Lachnospiraceae bacterium]
MKLETIDMIKMSDLELQKYYATKKAEVEASRAAIQQQLKEKEQAILNDNSEGDKVGAIKKARKEAAKQDAAMFLQQKKYEQEEAAMAAKNAKAKEAREKKFAATEKKNYNERRKFGAKIAKETSDNAKKSRKEYEDNLKNREKLENELADVQEAMRKAEADGIDKRTKEWKAMKKQEAELSKKAAEEEAKTEGLKKQTQKDEAMEELIGGITDDFTEKMNEAEDALIKYSGKISARLQGSGKSWATTSSILSMTLGANPFVKVTDAIENLNEAVNQGIAYNVESRAFLATVSDNIANTFDAFSEDMSRIIRLQQADTTAARLGMEANLTNFLNRMFEDSSYLTSAFDSVASALLEASSQMSYKGATEFEYVVQKWLGALSSLGLSNETVSTIATGLSYLATGDVQSLAGNSSLQTLMAMSASRAGIDYAEVLLEGLDAETTNKLLTSMVSYLKEIAEESENQVVKRAYGDVFNLSMSDLKAIQNITQSEISSISGANMSYSAMQAETTKQMLLQATRVALPAMLDNIYSNTLYGVAQLNNNNPAMWAMGKMLNFLDENETTINIPFINAMGFGLDLNSDVVKLMHMGYGIGTGMSLAATLLGGLGSMFAGGAGPAANETTRRGAAFGLNMGSTKGETSASQYVSSGSSSDMSTSTMSSATDDAEESKKITNKNSKPPEKTLDDLFEAIIGEKAKEFVRAEDVNLKSAYVDDKGGGSIRVAIAGMGENGLTVSLSESDPLYKVATRILGVVENKAKDQDKAYQAFEFATEAVQENGSIVSKFAGIDLSPDALIDVMKNGFAGFIMPTYDIGLNTKGGMYKVETLPEIGTVNGTNLQTFNKVTFDNYVNSHKTGLFKVPYNGYLAELHEGERILTAEEAKFYNQYSSAVNEIPSTPISNVALQPTADIEIDLTPLQGNLTSETEKIVTAINLLKAEVEKINNKPIQTQNSSIEAKTDKSNTDLASTLRQVLYGDNSEQTIGKLITHMLNGQININRINTAVPVKNDAGNKLQVSNLVW